MSANPIHLYTLEEYFALEHAGDARYEYWQGEVVCMSGGSKEHSRIARNVNGHLFSKTTGSSCEAFNSDSAVKTPELPPYRYPDASVVCGKAIFENIQGIDVLVNPVLLVEIISPTSEKRDMERKLEIYQAIPSVKEYLVIYSTKRQVIQFIKQESGEWSRLETTDEQGVVELTSVGCRLEMTDIYDRV
ncbi:MAG: Uma2 family endonuclease [Acidobacteria bacterium]|nr:Uma2 family endonuclease [Acidobacteriota bacterium]